MKQATYALWIISLIFVYVFGLMLGHRWGLTEAADGPPVVTHDRGRTAIVFDRFCDGWPDNRAPLRCDQILWCWTHRRREAIDWPLAEAIPFLKELEERSW